MASRNILAQFNFIQIASLTNPGAGFVGFSAKSDGLYQKIGAAADQKLLTASDLGAGYVPYTGATANLNLGTWSVTAGNVYVGVPVSSGKVVIQGGGSTSFIVEDNTLVRTGYKCSNDYSFYRPIIDFTKTRGTLSARTACLNGDQLGDFYFIGYDGTNGIEAANFGSIIDATVSSGLVPAAIYFATRNVSGGNPLERMRISSSGNVGIGVTSPAALLHLKAGTATANTAPLKFTSGTLLTAAEVGAMEFLTDGLYFTITTGTARKQISFTDHTHSGTYEPVLGNPGTNGYVLSSTTAGVRSWIAPGAPTPYALTKTDDTNVTLTLGGTPASSLLAATSLTLGWTGTLADGRIASAATWNAKQAGHTNLTSLSALSYVSASFVKMTASGTFALDTSTYLTGITKAMIEAQLTGDISTHTHSSYSLTSHNHSGTYEPVLGNPAANGYVLSSTTAGVRSWVVNSSSVAWGAITGTLSSQTDLNTALGNKQALHANLTSLSGLSWASSSPFVRMTNTGTFNLDNSSYQPFATNLTSLAGLTYASASFVKMTAVGTFALDTNAYSLTSHNHSGVYEPVLGNPSTNGYVLSSTAAGVRSWVAQSGGSYTLPLAANGTRGGVQVGYSNYMSTIGITLSGEQLVCNLTSATLRYVLDSVYAPINGSSSNAFATAALTVTGAITATTTITATGNITGLDHILSGSDIRLKTDIRKLVSGDWIKQVNLVEYKMKTDLTRARYGVVAQELERIAPHLVHTGTDGIKTVSYTDLLIAKIAYLEDELNKLKTEHHGQRTKH